jgi:23S rRNA pseudouridine2605 synthase
VQGSNVWLTFAIREGKNREVRNVLGHLGLEVNRLIRISFGPFQLGELAAGAVEEVRTRVLREQLGKKIAALADADFEGPRVDRDESNPDRETRARRLEQRPQRAFKDHGSRTGRPSFGRRRDSSSAVSSAKSGGRPHQDDRETLRKPRPWHGRKRDLPIEDRAATPDAPRKTKSGLLKDRKGRRVLVQRVQPERPPQPERPAAPFNKRGKPTRDRRGGPRPSRPQGRRDKS